MVNFMRDYWLKTQRIDFSLWTAEDLPLAELLWGDPAVSHYICAAGCFSQAEIQNRLYLEIENYKRYNIQYFPIFDLGSSALIGCCGLRPYEGRTDCCELGFHLRPSYWGQGLAFEAASAIINNAFSQLGVSELRAGHHPDNHPSRCLLQKLGFEYLCDQFYPPTGLLHPSYRLIRP